jgi:hypothetical protein
MVFTKIAEELGEADDLWASRSLILQVEAVS